MAMGIITMAAGAGIAWYFVATGSPRPMRVIVFIPFLMALLGLLQSRMQTCVVYAARGVRDGSGGIERVTDPGELKFLKNRSFVIILEAIAGAAALTLVTYFL